MDELSTRAAEAIADRAAKHTIHIHVDRSLYLWLKKIQHEGDWQSMPVLVASLLGTLQRDDEEAHTAPASARQALETLAKDHLKAFVDTYGHVYGEAKEETTDG